MASKFALDIFRVLDDLSRGDVLTYRKLSAEEKKGFSPLVIMAWMSGTSDARQIMALNTFANPCIFPLGKHPELLAQLLAACSSKTPRRYYWLGVKAGKKKNLSMQVIKDYFDYSSQEVRKMTIFPSDDEIIQMAEELGWQKDEMTKLKKEMKDG